MRLCLSSARLHCAIHMRYRASEVRARCKCEDGHMSIYIGAREPVGRGSRKALGLGTECSPRGGAPAPAGDVVANRGRERCEGASDEIKVVQGEHGEGVGLLGVLGLSLRT